MKELFISDLDGTLLTPEVTLSTYTTRILNRLYESGISFTVSTARTAATVGNILSGVRLSVPVILMNGVCTYDLAARRYCEVARLGDGEDALAGIIGQYCCGGFLYTINDGELATFWAGERTPHELAFMRERSERYGKRFTRTDSLPALLKGGCGAVYYSVAGKESELATVKSALSAIPSLRTEFYRDIYLEDYWYLEVCAASASKRSSLERLRAAEGAERVTGFGDNLNDLLLFAACDRKIAVENARAEVKAAADLTILSNREDGVARWLGENLLK